MKKATYTVGKQDFTLSWFSGKGAGGQHRNTHMNCCRLKHKDTGIIKTGQSHKERLANKKEALEAMAKDPRFLNWCHLKLCEIENGITIEEEVNKMMDPKNLKFEEKDENGNWKEKV